jgi:dipeptidase
MKQTCHSDKLLWISNYDRYIIVCKQVTIGESTCPAKLVAAPAGPTGGGKALLEASELSQIGLERGKTAREVIQIMGELAVKYGFYSSEWDGSSEEAIESSRGEAGEALSVADPDEAWMFHILPDDTGTSAIWVAQRLPDDHIAVVSNQFIIRDVIRDNPDFM